MRNISRGVCLIALLSLIFIFAGCEKKKIEQVGEVTPPPQQVEKEVAPTQPATPQMEIATPKEETVVQAELPAKAPEGVESVQKQDIPDGDVAVFEKDDIYFDYDRFNIRPEGRKILTAKAGYLNAHPDVMIRIEGHCDERGTTEYNLALGERRAKAAQEYLIFLGIKADRITTISYGEERPLDPGRNEEAWAKNRRAHFVVLGR